MNRVGRKGRGESTWLGFFLHGVLAEFAPLCEARGDAARAERYRSEAAPPRRACSSRPGTASGTGAATTTTARRSGSAQNDECRIDSIAQSWAVLSGAVPHALRRPRHGRRAHPPGPARPRAARCCSRRPSTARPQDPGLHQGLSARACARTAASTPTPRCGSVMAMARLGSGDEAVELFHMLNPVNHTRSRPTSSATRPSRTCSPATSTPTRHTPGARAGPGTRAPRAGCTAPGLESILGLRRRGDASRSTPASRRPGPSFTLTWRFGATRYEIAVANPERRCRGVAEAELDGAPVDPRAIPLMDDGGRHELKVLLGERVLAATPS